MAQNFEVIENKICTNKKNSELLNNIFGKYVDIVNIWETIGFDTDTINKRLEQLQQTVLDTLVDMEEGELDLHKQIKERINHYKKQVEHLQLRLKIDLNPLINKIAQSNDKTKYLVDNNTSLDLNQSVVLINQTKLLEENFFYKSLFVELEHIKEERNKLYIDLKLKQDKLVEQLDETLDYSIANKSVLNESDLKQVEENVTNLLQEREKRLQLLNKFNENIQLITDENQLDIDPKSSLYNIIHLNEDNDIDSESMNRYRKSMDKLISKRDELIDSIDTIRSDILSMWERYNIQNENFQFSSEYTQHNFQLSLNEYQRCVELKKFKLNDIISATRDDIQQLWSKLVLTRADTTDFDTFYNETNITEELLLKHEAYLSELRLYSEKYSSLFDCFQKWTNKWNDHVQFEIEYTDPSRFSKRNYSALYEERQRKHFTIELTKLEKNLEQEALNYYSNECKPFKYAGLSILDYVKEQRNIYDSNKRKERQIKKDRITTPMSKHLVKKFNAKTPNDKTPIRRANNAVANKTPQTLATSRVQMITSKTNAPDMSSKKRISFNKISKLKREDKRRSKSCDTNGNYMNDSDLITKVSLDTTLSGNYNSNRNKINKNDNLSSGIESIFGWSDIDYPACNSSFIL